MPSPIDDVIRNADGILEQNHIMVSQLGLDTCVAVSGRYVSTAGEVLTKQTLYPAIYSMVQKHGALGAQVRPGATPGTIPQFVRLHTLDLDTVVSFLDDEVVAVDELLRAQLGQPFALSVSAPLWRLVVVNGHTVVFGFHHAIADGQSGMALLSALLSALNDIDTNDANASNIVLVPPTSSMVGPAEAYADTSVSWSGLLGMAYERLVPQSWKPATPAATAWTGNPIPQIPSPDLTVRAWSIPPSQTTALLQLCRSNTTTLTAFLHTLLVGVLSRLLVAREEAGGYKTIAVGIPVSLRRFTGVSPFELCDHVSGMALYTPLVPIIDGKDFPWDTARTVAAELQERVPGSSERLGVTRILLRFVSHESLLKGALGKKRTVGLGLSNLGRFPLREDYIRAEDAKWRLESVFFAQSDVVRGSAFKANVVGSPEGATNVTFSWGKTAIDQGLAETLVVEMKATLDNMLG